MLYCLLLLAFLPVKRRKYSKFQLQPSTTTSFSTKYPQSTIAINQMTTTSTDRRGLTSTTIHVMALDGIVNVNSLFTLGLFLGLAVNPTDPNYTLVDSSNTTCLVSSSTAENLVAFHVYSFSSFLFSSLIAFGLKQAIRTAKNGDTRVQVSDWTIAHVNLRVLRAGILGSAAGSVSGCLFLTLALVDLVEIKLGKFGCSGWFGVAAVGPLVVLVPLALAIYICVVLHAFAT